MLRVIPSSSKLVLKALSNSTRLAILALLKKSPMSVSKIARTLGITQPTATAYVKMLEKTGLVFHRMQQYPSGYQKVCFTNYDGVELSWEEAPTVNQAVEYTLDMPVGHYCAIECGTPSLLASAVGIIASSEDTSHFLSPPRMEATLLVLGNGVVRYLFPYNIPASRRLVGLELSTEVGLAFGHGAGETALTASVNDRRLGVVAVGRGRPHLPVSPACSWWPKGLGGGGERLVWRLTADGVEMSAGQCEPLSLGDLGLSPMRPIEVAFTVECRSSKPNSVAFFGHDFGWFNQDIRLRLECAADE
ncbi:MAG: helix-turn-helix domain-containing protein [bacterium]|nr:helix-turn-helix domain-containing protein [Candidatus Sumerlaeota bacterium]